MTDPMRGILIEYAGMVSGLYASALKAVILYGSYARGDYTEDSDVDIMILAARISVLPEYRERRGEHLCGLKKRSVLWSWRDTGWILPGKTCRLPVKIWRQAI